MGARRKIKPIRGALQQFPTVIISHADPIKVGTLQAGVARALSFDLHLPGRLDPCSHDVAWLTASVFAPRLAGCRPSMVIIST